MYLKVGFDDINNILFVLLFMRHAVCVPLYNVQCTLYTSKYKNLHILLNKPYNNIYIS